MSAVRVVPTAIAPFISFPHCVLPDSVIKMVLKYSSVVLALLAVVWGIAVEGASFPCQSSAPLAGTKVCDTSLSFEKRAAELVSMLSVKEKAAQLGNNAAAISRHRGAGPLREALAEHRAAAGIDAVTTDRVLSVLHQGGRCDSNACRALGRW